MQLTTEQTLQQGIAAHKESKLEEAEHLYRVILQSQPSHPDANHNLGLIAVSVNKVELALPLFKTALEANPKVEQFWLSYIDALIKENHLETAKAVIEQGRKVGLVGDKFDVSVSQHKQITESARSKSSDKINSLTLKEKRKKIAESKQQKKEEKSEHAVDISPSKQQIKSLLEYYQKGQYSEAEKLAITFTQQFVKHHFSWKILGGIFRQTGRISEAINANQQAITLFPQDAEAHYNLGNTLQDMRRNKEAVTSYSRAISLQPDFAEAHYNLGNTLKELNRLEDSQASYKQGITLKPDYAESHSNLGIVLHELGRLEEAEASYRQAITLKPYYFEPNNNLGIILQQQGRLEEAEKSYKQAISIKPGNAEVHNNLGITQYINGDTASALDSMKKAHAIDPKFSKYELFCSVMQANKTRLKTKAKNAIVNKHRCSTRLTNNPLIINRIVERGLITALTEMNSRDINTTKDARYGSGRCSSGFNLFEENNSIIKTVAEGLITIMKDSVRADVYVVDSFFNILNADGGTNPHNHLKEIDGEHGLFLGRQKYSLVYYLSVGEQNCSEPGTLKLYEPNEEILPYNGMVTIIPASRNHSAVYNGKKDRVMIGSNFYSL